MRSSPGRVAWNSVSLPPRQSSRIRLTGCVRTHIPIQCAYARTQVRRDHMEGDTMTELITRDELAAALRDHSVVLLDTLPADHYGWAHIRGALNLVEADVESMAPQVLPDRDAAIVTYCANISCRNSENVASRLRALGYSNVRKYREGIADWESAGLPIDRAGTRQPVTG